MCTTQSRPAADSRKARRSFAFTRRVFQRFLPLMGRDRSVYAPDLAGCGESDGPVGRASAVDHGAAIGDFLDAMRFRQVDVLGYHAGALVAIELAIARPQQVRRLILVGVPESARERISLVIAQQIMVIRPKDDLWESTQRVRERLPKARFVDMPDQSSTLFEAAPDLVANAVKDFLRT